MDLPVNDLMIHISKTLDVSQFNRLAENVRCTKGVVSVGRDENAPRFISVGYSPVKASSIDILNVVIDFGLKAYLIGLLKS